MLVFESVPTEHMSSVEEPAVSAAVVVMRIPQLGRLPPDSLMTACDIPGCSAQKPGVRVKHWLHDPLGVKEQPEAGLQVSFVHALLSLHGAIGVVAQPVAGLQVSVVQALLSLHGAIGVEVQPVAALQVSVVQALLSLHGGIGVEVQPEAGLQVSFVQADRKSTR